MRKYILIFSVLLSSVLAQAGSGQIKIKLKSVTEVVATYDAAQVDIQKMSDGLFLSHQIVDVMDLDVSPAAAKKTMRSEKVLDVENYPQIDVSEVSCLYSTAHQGKCTGNLKVKGVTKPIKQASFKVENNILYLKFNFLLSDYNIAQKTFLFKIDNLALVEAAINLN